MQKTVWAVMRCIHCGIPGVSMTLSDELWSDCWSTLIFTCGDMDIMKSLPKERKKFQCHCQMNCGVIVGEYYRVKQSETGRDSVKQGETG